jgi:hypothetical protein
VNQPEPIIVDITEPTPGPIEGLAEVLVGAIGLTGALALLAVVCGAVLAALMFWVRSRSR